MLGIVIQARMGSKRLPGKIWKPIGGKLLLEYILARLEKLESKAEIIIATSTESRDDKIEGFCSQKGIHCFRGSEWNVLERYYQCAERYGLDEIVRLTADNPFVDVEELDNLIRLFRKEHADYAWSFDSLPCGMGAEVFTFKALEEDYREASMPHHFEHVNEFILEHMERFRTARLDVDKEKNCPELRVTVDTWDDYEKACYIASHGKAEYITPLAVICLARRYEEESSGAQI